MKGTLRDKSLKPLYLIFFFFFCVMVFGLMDC